VAKSYFDDLRQRRATEALAELTGWNIDEIYQKAGAGKMAKPSVWWNNRWRQSVGLSAHKPSGRLRYLARAVRLLPELLRPSPEPPRSLIIVTTPNSNPYFNHAAGFGAFGNLLRACPLVTG
jgi:hypothetical protein